MNLCVSFIFNIMIKNCKYLLLIILKTLLWIYLMLIIFSLNEVYSTSVSQKLWIFKKTFKKPGI